MNSNAKLTKELHYYAEKLERNCASYPMASIEWWTVRDSTLVTTPGSMTWESMPWHDVEDHP
jgi:hypothetical protein